MADTNPPSEQATSSPIPTTLAAQIDLLIALHLHAWPALTLAIQNNWGGSPQVSQDKRDWLAGAISELLTSSPPQLADVGDLEEVLLQVMTDEFEVVVDDDSAEEVAKKIWSGCQKLGQGDVSELEVLYRKWEERQKKGEKRIEIVRGEDQDGEETDWDDEDDEDEDDGERSTRQDVSMDDAPALVESKKAAPEIDEDGFTKVVGKKKR